jgi:hypothetical protein
VENSISLSNGKTGELDLSKSFNNLLVEKYKLTQGSYGHYYLTADPIGLLVS